MKEIYEKLKMVLVNTATHYGHSKWIFVLFNVGEKKNQHRESINENIGIYKQNRCQFPFNYKNISFGRLWKKITAWENVYQDDRKLNRVASRIISGIVRWQE